MNLNNWIKQHIAENPKISHGSLWRDFCFSKIRASYEDFYSELKELISDGSIVKIISNNHYSETLYDIGTQLRRNKIIDELFD